MNKKKGLLSAQQISRAARNAGRLEEICANIRSNGGQINAQNDEERLAELRTLCMMVPGTPEFQEYLLRLLDTGELKLAEALKFFFVDVPSDKWGVFTRPAAQEFERMMILFELPRKICAAENQDDAESVSYLKELVSRWTESFRKKYQQPVDTGVNLEELERVLQHINELGGDENVESLPT